MSERETVREACRKGLPLDGSDAQALEHALVQVERQLAAAEARLEEAIEEIRSAHRSYGSLLEEDFDAGCQEPDCEWCDDEVEGSHA